MPNNSLRLSISRSLGLDDGGLWQIGHSIEEGRSETLHGRADVKALSVTSQNLVIQPSPTPANRLHAEIVGWPQEKDKQKMKAIEIAAEAVYHEVPS